MLLAWCCLCEDFCRFRPERIETAPETGESFRPRRVALLRDFGAQMRNWTPPAACAPLCVTAQAACAKAG